MNHSPNNNNVNADDDDDAGGDEDDAICQEAMTLLQKRLNLPSRLRDRTMVQFAQQFITNVKEDIYSMCTDMRTVEQGYDGLDSDRDTEDEVATAIRCCPEVLTRRDDLFGLYPIQCLTSMQSEDNKFVCNVKAVSFVPLFARLAIDFNSFEENTRGGLLIEYVTGNNVLQYLATRVDTTLVAVLIRLRRSGYLVQEDIQQYDLVHKVCRVEYFSEQRFRFLIEIDPASLLQTDENGCLPLHWVAHTMREFRVVLDAYVRFYPRWQGINALFTIDNDGDTPFLLACELLTHTKAMEVIEELLVRYTTDNGRVNTNHNTNNGNAMILAASDDTISLDGLFFLIRRQPDTMLSMLRHREEEELSTTMVSSSNSSNNNNRITNRTIHDSGVDSTSTASEENNGTEDGRHNENTNTTGDNSNDDHGVNTNHNTTVTVLRRSTRKRKRN